MCRTVEAQAQRQMQKRSVYNSLKLFLEEG